MAENMTARDLARGLSEAMARVRFGGSRFLVTLHGRPAVAIVPVVDLERLNASEAEQKKAGK